jgi:hypothetical protein
MFLLQLHQRHCMLSILLLIAAPLKSTAEPRLNRATKVKSRELKPTRARIPRMTPLNPISTCAYIMPNEISHTKCSI